MEPEQYFEGRSLEIARAIQANDRERINELATQADLNHLYKQDMSLLMWALVNEKPAAVRELIRLGANPDLKLHNGLQPIGYAAASKDKSDCLQVLLESGANPNGYYNTYTPAQHEALAREYWHNVVTLLDAGADINAKDSDENTILSITGNLSWFEKAIYLIERGASIPDTDSGKGIAWNAQENSPNPGTETYELQKRLKQLLVKKGVHFPVARQWEKKYAPLREQWYRTALGYEWQQRLQQVADDPIGFGKVWKEAKVAENAAFKAWMNDNGVAEPK